MKAGKPKKAPKVKIFDSKKNFMREFDTEKKGGIPMSKKRLSK